MAFLLYSALCSVLAACLFAGMKRRSRERWRISEVAVFVWGLLFPLAYWGFGELGAYICIRLKLVPPAFHVVHFAMSFGLAASIAAVLIASAVRSGFGLVLAGVAVLLASTAGLSAVEDPPPVLMIATFFLLPPLVWFPLPVVAWRRRRERRAGHCDRCGYSLASLSGGVCPECGTPSRA
jgi:uncharacterized membrane protein YsdA (DUF1294 family)